MWLALVSADWSSARDDTSVRLPARKAGDDLRVESKLVRVSDAEVGRPPTSGEV
jgi:hypothetical protein